MVATFDLMDLQRRYLETIETIVSECCPVEMPVTIALSGGLDSVTLVAAFRNRFPKRELRTFTMEAANRSPDSIAGEMVARHFGTKHRRVMIKPEDLLDNLDVVRGTRIASVSRLTSHISLHIALNEVDQLEGVVLSGHGGDIVVGTWRDLYEPPDPSLTGYPHPELRRQMADHYFLESKDIGRHLARVCDSLGVAYYMPYRDPRLAFVADLPDQIVGPQSKEFVRGALRDLYHLDQIVDRPKTSLQRGLGLQSEVRQLLKSRHGERGMRTRDIVRKLTS